MKKQENEGKDRLLKVMRYDGWLCRKLNVSAGIYSTPDFPDLFCVNKRIRELCYYHNELLYNKVKKLCQDEIFLHAVCGRDVQKAIYLNNDELMILSPYRWIECKVPEGKLSPGQSELFGHWMANGVGVWVMHDEKDYSKLFQPPNFWQLAMRGKIR